MPGVPPQFDFKGSQNVKQVDVLWPAPERLPEAGGISIIGYERDVILPLRIVPQDRGKPVALRLKLDYAICEKLCVPAEAKAELALEAGPASQDAALAAAEGAGAEKAGARRGAAGSIRSVRREDGSAPAARLGRCRGARRNAGRSVRRGADAAMGAAAADRRRRRAGRAAAFRLRARRRAARGQVRGRAHHAHGGRRGQAIEVATRLD